MNKAAGQSAIGYVANHAVHAGVLGLQRRTRRCWPERSFGGEKLNALAFDMFEKKDDIVVKAKAKIPGNRFTSVCGTCVCSKYNATNVLSSYAKITADSHQVLPV